MSDTEKPARKAGKTKKMLLIGGGVLVIAGGGVGAGLYASSSITRSPEAEAHADLPQLVLREGVDESVALKFASATGDARPDPSKFKASYYPLGEQFTVNLVDADGFIQVGLGVSTYYDERVLENVKLHEMAVRSAVLMTLSQQSMLTVTTAQGKDALKANLKAAVNNALKAREGFGGIDDVYFTSFVVQ